jgi:sarcosine oxidase, subunit gamma
MADAVTPSEAALSMPGQRNDDQFAVTPAPALGRLALRGDDAVAQGAGAALGLTMPRSPLASVSAGDTSALWLGPDEWLVLVPAERLSATIAALSKALAALPHSLVDVSHRQVGLALSGRLAARVLTSGCPLDLGAQAFPLGMVTRTLFHKAEIVLWRRADGFHLEVWRSFAPYVLGHLAVARRAAEGLPEAALPR